MCVHITHLNTQQLRRQQKTKKIIHMFIRCVKFSIQCTWTRQQTWSDHRHSFMPLRWYHKGPHEVFSGSRMDLYILQSNKDFISALQFEDSCQETVPQILPILTRYFWRWFWAAEARWNMPKMSHRGNYHKNYEDGALTYLFDFISSIGLSYTSGTTFRTLCRISEHSSAAFAVTLV